MTIKRALLLSSILGGAVLAAGTAFAAPPSGAAPTTAAADATGDTSNGQVIVTAEKRVASVQRVPIAVSAFTSKQRDIIGVDNLMDLTNFTPGLRYAPALDRIFLRGVGRQTNNLATDPGVATYVDGVYNSQTYTAGQDQLFVQRIEVLRGPQGTLYGRNGIGGAINTISATPTNSFYAEGRVSAGNYDRYTAEGAVSGPINDDLKFRFAGEYASQGQGYFHNLATGGTSDGNGSSYYLEAQLSANLGPHVEAWVKASTYWFDTTYGTTNDVGFYNNQFALFNPFAPAFPVAAYVYGGFTGAFTQTNPAITGNPGMKNQWDFSNNTPSKITQTGNYNLIGHLTWHADGVDVKYIGGAAHYRLDLWSDNDGTDVTSMTIPLHPIPPAVTTPCATLAFLGCGPITFNPSQIGHYVEDKSYYSNELNLISTYDSPLQWVLGLYQYHEQYSQPVTNAAPGYPGLNSPVFFATGFPTAPKNPGSFLSENNQIMHADSYAGFAQIDWKITPDVKVTGGIRYTYDDKAGTEYVRSICAGCAGIPGFDQTQYGTFTPVLDVTAFPTVISYLPAKGAGPVSINPTTGFAQRSLSGNWSAVTGTLGAEWTPDPTLLLYAKYSRGYKSGGFNSGQIIANPEVGPEFLDDYEAGIKKTFNHNLTVDAAVFYYNYTGMQIEIGDYNSGGNLQFNLAGLPDVHNYGFELESTWQATPDLQFVLSYAYLNTRIAANSCNLDFARLGAPSSPSCVITGVPGSDFSLFNVKGNQLIDAPPNKVALNANYTFHFGPGNLTLSASDTWTDYHYSSIFSTSSYYTPAYNDLGLRALWNDVNNRYTIIVYGKNVLNAVEYDYIYPIPTKTVSLQAPVTYGVELQVRFR